MPRPNPSRLFTARKVATVVVSTAALTTVLFSGTAPAFSATNEVTASDSFTRTTAAGWGTADSGGAWSSPAGESLVNGSSGNLVIKNGQGFSNTLNGFSARTTDLQIAFSLNKLPTAGDMYINITPRQVGTSEYRAKVKVSPDGAVRLDMARILNGVETNLQSNAGGFTAKASSTMNVKISLSGTDKTTIGAVVWASGTPVPSNQINVADSSAALQTSGTVALGGYVGTAATNAPITVRYDNLKVTGNKEAAATPPQQPSASDSRDKLVNGQYKPSTTTTGVIAGTALKPYNTSGADLVITQDGTVLDGLEIWGDIKVRAANVTIKNSRLHGGTAIPKSNTGIVDANDARVKNLVVQDSTIIPQRPSYYRDGIVGHDYTALRNHITQTNDGLGIFNRPAGPAAANVVAKGNYIHGLTYWSNDPAHSDGSHNDGIQVQGGENILIAGNQIVGDVVAGAGSAQPVRGAYTTTAMLLQQNVAKLKNVVVEENYIDGGLTSVTVDSTSNKQASVELTLRNNYFGRNQYAWDGAKYQIRIINKAASTVTGLQTNKWADTLAPLTEGTNKGIYYTNK
ncbi:hypothetical protein [Arthrobacter sp. GMC3]|uniref:hypothetical protein n=1 Tax=Arthrobacter sp. GMC3 TaxID=2058894 RepID=UPI000CE5415F|nr:hypothetical protein [Arthrobacter sp. GMC3]